MYQLYHTVAEIGTADFIRDYRDADKFIGFCKRCRKYGACWACPPFDFDVDEYISAYERAYIIGTKVYLNDVVSGETGSPADRKEAAYRIFEEARRKLDDRLLEMERERPGGKAFFAGSCVGCTLDACTRIVGLPCICPDKIRPSLESVGFDIGKTSSELLGIELKWGNGDSLPEYYTLVSGFFTNDSLTKDFSIE